MPALALLELDELGPELDEHDNLTRGIDLPPGPDGLLLVPCLSLSTLTHRWTVRMWLGSFRRSFCSSSYATNLARRCWTGSFPVFERAVNESDFRTGMYRFYMVG
jgi:hypothetical protein